MSNWKLSSTLNVLKISQILCYVANFPNQKGPRTPSQNCRKNPWLWICNLLKATTNIAPAGDRTPDLRDWNPTLYPCASPLHYIRHFYLAKQFCFLDSDCLVVGKSLGSSRRSVGKYPVKPLCPEGDSQTIGTYRCRNH